jgi:hypothetical protein
VLSGALGEWDDTAAILAIVLGRLAELGRMLIAACLVIVAIIPLVAAEGIKLAWRAVSGAGSRGGC